MIVYPCWPRHALFQYLHLPQRKKRYEETQNCNLESFQRLLGDSISPKPSCSRPFKTQHLPSLKLSLVDLKLDDWKTCFLFRALNGLCSVGFLLLVSPRPLEVRRSQHLRHFGPGWNSRDSGVLRGVGVIFNMLWCYLLWFLIYCMCYNGYHYLWLCDVVCYTCYLFKFYIRT